MNYQRVMMYGATMASACWFVLGIVTGINLCYVVAMGFICIAGLYWDQS